ncbi:MAG: hypothetical protein SPLM_06740 [Spiroplasma phoeniceum]|uniref:hypothetical protein n=1 Tax=Spiroplasma phoeniceum TaxID=47835 RepID=UPI003285E897
MVLILSNAVLLLLQHSNNILTSIVCSKASTVISPSEILSYDTTINVTNLTKLEAITKYNRLTNQTTVLPLSFTIRIRT